MDTIRQTKLIVNTKYIEHNITELQNFVGPNVTVMPVIKARGYGTGIGTQADLFKKLNIKILCVAVIDEGIALRERGYNGEILVLNQPLKEEVEIALKYGLTLSVCILDFIIYLDKLSNQNNKISKIHLEINTGMNRTGINPKDIHEYLSVINTLKFIKLDGIYSHLSSSDTDIEYSNKQIEIFDNIAKIVKKEANLKYIHICNTGGILNFPTAHYTAVRPGISIYGYLPNKNLKNKINLIPATALKSKISYIHEIEKGGFVSYNRSFVSDKYMKIATIPIGYADGIPRIYQGQVVINNKLANIVGVINMDSFMVDITDIPNSKIGDDIYIWDNKNITIEKIAKECNTINYEILSRLTPRVVKEFI